MKKDVSIFGKQVGEFVVYASAPSTIRGDAQWRVRCVKCGAQYVMRATLIREAIRDGKPLRVCDCKRSMVREMKERLAAERQLIIEKRKQEANEYHTYCTQHRLLYYTWGSMNARCTRMTHPKYKHYGARGITVCNEWSNDFRAFCEWSLAHGYRQGLSIDRIDNDSGYSPDNCRWTTYSVQNRNKRHYKCRKGNAKVL